MSASGDNVTIIVLSQINRSLSVTESPRLLFGHSLPWQRKRGRAQPRWLKNFFIFAIISVLKHKLGHMSTHDPLWYHITSHTHNV